MSKHAAKLLILTLLLPLLMIHVKPVSAASPDTWTSKTPMNEARGGLGVAVVNGKIYAIGGSTVQTALTSYTSGGIVGTNEEYNPAANSWINRKPMPTPRARFATAVYQNKIYCMGGFSEFSSFTGELQSEVSVIEVYDPATDNWSTISPMPVAGAGLQANVVDDKIFLLGGISNPDACLAYDPATDSWTNEKPIPDSSSLFCSTVVDGKIVAIIYFFNNVIGQNARL